MEACDNHQDLFERVSPFAGLLRRDSFGNFVLVTRGSIYVTKGSDRRSTGTHYTSRSLTEPIVKHALDPLVYLGPAEGWPEEQWQLKSAAALLDLKICNMAMGSGAFLVQTCHYLAEKLVLAWELVEQQYGKTPHKPLVLPEVLPSRDQPEEELLPIDREERLAVARRLVSERCLYGVDKNPMAVEMAKLSLWLITLAKNRPFTFLDHALRSGDSLLGASLKQITEWSMGNDKDKHSLRLFMEPSMRKALDIALKRREQIRTLSERDVHDIEAKEKLLREANESMALVKLGADLLVATALSEPRRRDTIRDTLHLHYQLLVSSYEDAREQHFTENGLTPARKSFQEIRTEIDEILQASTPFHWPLEFPEVFNSDANGFNTAVGNPPFMGGSKITGALGPDYREYLVEYLANGKRGLVDLCAYFFLLATHLTCLNGTTALIATNTIAQGDTRKVGLEQITVEGWKVYHAVSSRTWPGEANLEIAEVWLYNGKWKGKYLLADKYVEQITSFLTSQTQENPYSLIANAGKCFEGSKVYGSGFVLAQEEALALSVKDPRNKDILFPYLNGEDLNSRPDQSPSRWVINFHDWPLEKAEKYPDCMKLVREKVKPERDKNNRQVYRDRWWHYAEKRPTLYATIATMKRVLVLSRVSAHHFLGNYSGLLPTCQRRGNQVKYRYEARRTASPSRRKSHAQSVGR